MTNTDAETTIYIEILKQRIIKTISKLENTGKLKRELAYHTAEVNKSLTIDFVEYYEILQSVVDNFYFNYYDVNQYIEIQTNNLEFSVKHNIEILNSMLKLLKFVE